VPRGLPFENGDRLDQPTFHRLYLTTPEGVKAELVGGIVYVASPVSARHGGPHFRMANWLGYYVDSTPGVKGYDNSTNILDPKSEPQPDLSLIIDPRLGGRTSRKKGIIIGPAEMVVEIANSSVALDLGGKKQDYEQAGVGEYVVVLVAEKKTLWFRNDAGRFVELAPTDGLLRSVIFPGLWLDPAGVFARSGRRLAVAVRQGTATPEHAAFVAALRAKRTPRKPKP